MNLMFEISVFEWKLLEISVVIKKCKVDDSTFYHSLQSMFLCLDNLKFNQADTLKLATHSNTTLLKWQHYTITRFVRDWDGVWAQTCSY